MSLTPKNTFYKFIKVNLDFYFFEFSPLPYLFPPKIYIMKPKWFIINTSKKFPCE